MKYDYNYHKNPEKGYPKTIWWKIDSGPPGERYLYFRSMI